MARNSRRAPAQNPTEELIQLATDLDLTALANALPDLLEGAENESPSFTDFGLTMFRSEIDARKTRRLERSLKRSRLGAVEGLEGFDFTARPKLDPRVVKELFGCRFVAEHRNVLCLGRAGLGKTRIAKAIAHAACLADYSVLYVLAADMIEELHASHADRTFKRAFRRFVKPEVLLTGIRQTPPGIYRAHRQYRLQQVAESLPIRGYRCCHRRPPDRCRYNPPVHRKELPPTKKHRRCSPQG